MYQYQKSIIIGIKTYFDITIGLVSKLGITIPPKGVIDTKTDDQVLKPVRRLLRLLIPNQ
jgi:hypothetical protein